MGGIGRRLSALAIAVLLAVACGALGHEEPGRPGGGAGSGRAILGAHPPQLSGWGPSGATHHW